MPILEHDIQILASQVLADVPEGGGAATGVEVVDGQSNNLFPDISELDRVYGAVNLRKVFVGVRTEDTDGYFGAHIIVSDPPDDPDVSCVLMDTGDSFDVRSGAASRIESYLAQGAAYPGLLFGNHIAGQMVVMLIQRVEVELPFVGGTVLLRKNEGLLTQTEQYVRIIDVGAVERTFTDSQGDFKRLVVTLKISDQLQADYPGFDAVRIDSAVNFAGKTKTYETTVADASRYYGISKVTQAGQVGDFTIQVEDISAQLVPSSRSETAIADARVSQRAVALVPGSAAPVTFNVFGVLSPASSLYIGGSVTPGTFSLTRDGNTLTDLGGTLQSGGVSVGTIDYANGVLVLSANVFGTAGGNHAVTYTPAGKPQTVTDTFGIPVTLTTQALTYVVSIEPVPARGSLQVSYLSKGRWYVLQDDGSGAMRGASASVGAGNLNYTTGTVALTFGALPDVGSKVILAWSPKSAMPATEPATIAGAARVSFPITFPSAIVPGTLAITWDDGTPRSVGDSAGALTGDATGLAAYGEGRVELSPSILPAPGTPFNFTATLATRERTDVNVFGESGATWTAVVGGNIKPRSLRLSVHMSFPSRTYPGVDENRTTLIELRDNGSGSLVGMNDVVFGTVNYTTGDVVIAKSVSAQIWQGKWETVSPLGSGTDPKFVRYVGDELRTVTLSVTNGPATGQVTYPGAWLWWLGPQTQALKAEYAGANGVVHNGSSTFDQFAVRTQSLRPGFALTAGTSFRVGQKRYVMRDDGSLLCDINSATGTGTAAGNAAPSLGSLNVTVWQAGAASTVLDWAGNQAPPLLGADTRMLTDGVVFRTASAPLVPGGFSLQGTFDNGTPFNATANADGVINGGGVIGTVDYQTGVVEVRFGTPTASTGAGIVSLAYLGVPGVTNVKLQQVQSDTIRYNAVAYTYLPLKSNVLGLNPVRLPSDGRVPVYRAGDVVVTHHTAQTIPAVVSNGQTINTARTRLARLRVIGADDVTIETGYTANLDAGTVTFTNVSGYAQPVRVEHRIEDVALLADAQLGGLLRLNRPLSHDYPIGSYVSSALIIGNMQARVSSLFDQGTWNASSPVWSDDPQGSGVGATYDQINHPPIVTNRSAVTERWALVFTGSTTFSIYGEHFGLIGTSNTAVDCMPLNPATGQPYFRLKAAGFGSGWSAGNVIRLNTVGALAPFWWARVIKQGVGTVESDAGAVLVRGDIDTP